MHILMKFHNILLSMPTSSPPPPFLPPSVPPPFISRAGYTKHTLWATAYHPQERYPGGEFPNQDPRPVCGLPLYAAKDR